MVAGWLKTLVGGLLVRRFLTSKHPTMIRASRSNAPSMDPTTMPAICPPLRPLFVAAAAVGVLVPDGVPPIVKVVTIACNDDDAITGSATPAHLSVVFEKTQHESVAFGELAPQYEHSDPRFELYPQSSGSFATALIHDPVNEFAGSAQLVKSARICVSASEPALPQTSLAVISCSLCAYSAHDAAHSGAVASPVRPQGCAEFWMIALQSTLVVYRA